MHSQCNQKNILNLDKIHAATSMTYSFNIPDQHFSTYRSRGTGFFIKYKNHKFLLTARHNCINTSGDVDLEELNNLFIIQDPSKFYTEDFVNEFSDVPFLSFSIINLNLKNDPEVDDYLILRILSNPPEDKYCFDIALTVHEYDLFSTYYIIGYPREKYELTETETHRIHEVSPQVVQIQGLGIVQSRYQIHKMFQVQQEMVKDFSGFSGSPIVSCNNKKGLILEALCINATTNEDNLTKIRGIPIEIILTAIDGFIDRIVN